MRWTFSVRDTLVGFVYTRRQFVAFQRQYFNYDCCYVYICMLDRQTFGREIHLWFLSIRIPFRIIIFFFFFFLRLYVKTTVFEKRSKLVIVDKVIRYLLDISARMVSGRFTFLVENTKHRVPRTVQILFTRFSRLEDDRFRFIFKPPPVICARRTRLKRWRAPTYANRSRNKKNRL